MTIWDRAVVEAPYPYNEVAAALSRLVSAASIKDLFLVGKNERSFGAIHTHAQEEDGSVTTWNHLHTGKIPRAKCVASPSQDRGHYRTTVQVFKRGLVELTTEAAAEVLALIDSNNLYRGAEHREAVAQFLVAKQAFDSKQTPWEREAFVWAHARGPAARFRNTVIGTLVSDLSDRIGIEQAVGRFEAKVAPQNYKRTKALITPGMVKKAMETIEELGLESALERRFARIDDISINDVLWVDNAVKPLMKGGIGEVLMQHATTPVASDKDEERAEKVSLDDFMQNVLPTATGMEVPVWLWRGERP